ncbi:CsbD family protein [Marinococcus halophilus]|uniref:UPF0337 protein n=1 Tax=Marinococcus halophilus TaxID=1371 RepID=A0A510Y388_MARHA|nr:CsbD family protein [Marinococcus halophilus]OZT81809.1 CsbD family protein [Marinococcus halophilus]GEK57774.1 UPF0337 protein [Marinococcus halophilus]
MADKKGLSDKVKGEAKDQAGNAKDDPKMQRDAKKDKVKGEVQNKTGDAKRQDEEK